MQLAVRGNIVKGSIPSVSEVMKEACQLVVPRRASLGDGIHSLCSGLLIYPSLKFFFKLFLCYWILNYQRCHC